MADEEKIEDIVEEAPATEPSADAQTAKGLPEDSAAEADSGVAESDGQGTDAPDAPEATEGASAGEAEADAGEGADAGGADEAPVEKVAPITTASTPQQRKAARDAAKLAASGSRPSRSVEERQAERDETRSAKAVARTRRRGQARDKYKASDHERVPTPAREHVVGLKKTRQGIVVSDKAAKTITVRIDDARPHRRYNKIVRTSMTLHAHDEANDAHIGDTVVVQESRPLSATKRWRLIQVVERAK